MAEKTSSKPAAKFPSFNWMRGITRDRRISIVHRLVLLQILIHRQKDGRCDPGYQTVADELGVDRATVFRAVDVAIRRGWLAGFPKHGGGTRRNFIFTFPDPQQSQGSDGSTVAGQRRSKKPTVAGKRPNSRTPAHKQSQATLEDHDLAGEFAPNGHFNGQRERAEEYISEPPDFASPDSKEDARSNPDRKTGRESTFDSKDEANVGNLFDKKNDVQEVDRAAAFADFLAAYPKRVAVAQGEKAWLAKIKAGADPADMIAGAKRYGIERIAEEPTDERKRWKFTKDPATWLNAECWRDEPSPAAGTVTIDQHGNVIETPPRPSRPQSMDEIVEDMLAAIDPNDGNGGWGRKS